MLNIGANYNRVIHSTLILALYRVPDKNEIVSDFPTVPFQLISAPSIGGLRIQWLCANPCSYPYLFAHGSFMCSRIYCIWTCRFGPVYVQGRCGWYGRGDLGRTNISATDTQMLTNRWRMFQHYTMTYTTNTSVIDWWGRGQINSVNISRTTYVHCIDVSHPTYPANGRTKAA
jgi:hypothetical protein